MNPELEAEGAGEAGPGDPGALEAAEPRPRLPTSGAALASGVVLVLGLLVTGLLWYLLDERQEIEIERKTEEAARAISGSIDGFMGAELEALRRRHALWEAGKTPGSNEWYREAFAFLGDHPAFVALARQKGGEPTDIAGSAVALLRVREVAAQGLVPPTRGELVVGPVSLSGGRYGFGVQLGTPADAGGARARTLFAVLDPGSAIARIVDRQGSGYDVSVAVRGAEIYGRGEPASEAAPSRFDRTEVIRTGPGESWLLSIRPSHETLERERSQGPRLVLAAGLVLSILIAALVHIGQLSRERARALRTNVGLRDEIERSRLDESEIRLLNESLDKRVRERTAELNDTIAELETFNYSVSHDLRSPLGAVINFAAILKEDYDAVLDDTGREYLQRLVASARVAVSLMDALLAFSRSGRDEIRRSVVPMRKLAEEVVAEISAGSRGLPPDVRIDDLPDATADPQMMRFVFMNLIGNAVKFARPGEPPRLEIGGTRSGGEVIYFVRDSGIGFDMRYAGKLFRVFERLHTGEPQEGHGVGLAIVARLVRRHGGRVFAQGALGKGATFHFALPAEPEEGGDGGRG